MSTRARYANMLIVTPYMKGNIEDGNRLTWCYSGRKSVVSMCIGLKVPVKLFPCRWRQV